jgi:hypothetical protein
VTSVMLTHVIPTNSSLLLLSFSSVSTAWLACAKRANTAVDRGGWVRPPNAAGAELEGTLSNAEGSLRVAIKVKNC